MKGHWSHNLQFWLRNVKKSLCQNKWIFGICNSLLMGLSQDQQQGANLSLWLLALVTCDRWQVTPDTWQVTGDTWHLTKKKKKIFYLFFWYQWYYPHMSRDSVSPICGVFFLYFRLIQNKNIWMEKLIYKITNNFKLIY